MTEWKPRPTLLLLPAAIVLLGWLFCREPAVPELPGREWARDHGGLNLPASMTFERPPRGKALFPAGVPKADHPFWEGVYVYPVERHRCERDGWSGGSRDIHHPRVWFYAWRRGWGRFRLCPRLLRPGCISINSCSWGGEPGFKDPAGNRVLNRGSIFYNPAGQWKKAKTGDGSVIWLSGDDSEPSVSIPGISLPMDWAWPPDGRWVILAGMDANGASILMGYSLHGEGELPTRLWIRTLPHEVKGIVWSQIRSRLYILLQDDRRTWIETWSHNPKDQERGRPPKPGTVWVDLGEQPHKPCQECVSPAQIAARGFLGLIKDGEEPQVLLHYFAPSNVEILFPPTPRYRIVDRLRGKPTVNLDFPPSDD